MANACFVQVRRRSSRGDWAAVAGALVLSAACAACGPTAGGSIPSGGSGPGLTPDLAGQGLDLGTGQGPAPGPAADDADQDGYTIADGDCNDYDTLVGPGALEVSDNFVDDDCDGQTDEVATNCDSTALGMSDAQSLARALGLCDPRFLQSAQLNVADALAAAAMADYGTNFAAREGSALAVISTGRAAREGQASYQKPQPGANFSASSPNPDPAVPVVPGCGQSSQPSEVYDLTELVVTLKVPQNARSFSFSFNYYSSEFPEWVCNQFNDTFLVEMQSPNEYPTPANIAFDMNNQALTVNNAFFRVCDNWNTSRTQGCTQPGSLLDGSGYDDSDPAPGSVFGVGGGPQNRLGGATGWLTTTAPVTPGEEITLRFIVFDAGDGILDSATLLDDFQWKLEAASAPQTIP